MRSHLIKEVDDDNDNGKVMMVMVTMVMVAMLSYEICNRGGLYVGSEVRCMVEMTSRWWWWGRSGARYAGRGTSCI